MTREERERLREIARVAELLRDSEEPLVRAYATTVLAETRSVLVHLSYDEAPARMVEP